MPVPRFPAARFPVSRSAAARSAAERDHHVVCCDNRLAYRIAEALINGYGERVTVILPSRQRNHGPQISALPGVRVIERAELTIEAFNEAGIRSARALALVWQDDLGNYHAALRAQELNPDLRLVLAIFNGRLGARIRSLFPDCAVLSGTSMSAPSFVAAALGEPAPSHVRVSGRTLYAARGEDVDAAHVVCGIALIDDSGAPRLLAPGQAGADLVLAIADGTPRDPLARRRDPLRAVARAGRQLVWNKFGLVFMVLLAVALAGFAVLATAASYSVSNALYLTAMDMAGAALTNPALGGSEKFAQFMLTFDGMAILPAVTAAVVGARITGATRGRQRRMRGHVIVVGLGNVGSRVAGQLHDLGFDVVCVDKDPAASGVPMARRLGMPVVIGEAFLEETLHAAGIETSMALVSVTSRDVVNLETALHAREIREDLRIVLRMYDDDLAERVQKTIGNTISRSVSYLAAPAFVVAMLEHQVLRTIPVGRHVLLIADVQVSVDADLAGCPIEQVEDGGEVRVLALQLKGLGTLNWSPHRGYLLTPQDRLLVLATRAGLTRTLAGNQPRGLGTYAPKCLAGQTFWALSAAKS
jgi:Trk K+ transport system NAD-binding subunit